MTSRLWTIVTIVLVCDIAGSAQQPVRARPPAVSKKPATNTNRSASAGKPKCTPLSRERVIKLFEETPDSVTANEIEGCNLDFEPDDDMLDELRVRFGRDKRPMSFGALEARIPAGPTLADVQARAPLLLNELKDVVVRKDDELLSSYLHPEMLKNKDRVFAMLDPTRFRKFRTGKFVEVRERKRVYAPVFIYTSDGQEKLYYVTFATSRGQVAIRDVRTGPQIYDQAFATEISLAIEKLQSLFRSLNENQTTTEQLITTEPLFEELRAIGGWKRLVRKQTIDPLAVKYTPRVAFDQNALRVTVNVTYPLPDGEMSYNVDFDRTSGSLEDAFLKVVRLRDKDGATIAVDKTMHSYVPKRYGVTAELPEIVVIRTEDMRFRPVDNIVDFSRQALKHGDKAQLARWAQELKASFPADGQATALEGTIEYLSGNFAAAYEKATFALKLGAMVYFPVTEYDQLPNSIRLTPAILGISRQGAHFIPLEAGGTPEQKMIGAVKPVLSKTDAVLVLRDEKRNLKLIAPYSQCLPSAPAPAGIAAPNNQAAAPSPLDKICMSQAQEKTAQYDKARKVGDAVRAVFGGRRSNNERDRVPDIGEKLSFRGPANYDAFIGHILQTWTSALSGPAAQ